MFIGKYYKKSSELMKQNSFSRSKGGVITITTLKIDGKKVTF